MFNTEIYVLAVYLIGLVFMLISMFQDDRGIAMQTMGYGFFMLGSAALLHWVIR